MLSKSSRLPGGLFRLILLLSLVLGISLRPVSALGAAAGDAKSGADAKGAVAPAGGRMIPVSAQAGTSETIRVIEVTSATQISTPLLESPSVAPVINKVPMAPVTSPPPEAKPGPAEATPTALPAPATTGLGALGASFSGTDHMTSAALGAAAPATALPGLGGGEGQQPVFMRDIKPLEIFDPGKGEDLTSMQKVAKMMADRQSVRERFSLANIQNLNTYEYELEGPSEAKIEQEAQTRALLSAAGRVYFDDYLILGLDILEPYLRQNGKSFIARTTIVEHRTLSATRVQMRVRVSVNLNALMKELENKHFLAKPNLRPIVAVLLQEIVNGERNTMSGGRRIFERTLEQNMFQVYSEKMRQPGLDADAGTSARLLKDARMEAQRNNVDVIITGTLLVQPENAQKIYFDNYSFKDAQVSLKMYRVDTGELLAQVTDRYSAAAGQNADSTRKVLEAMLGRTAQKLSDQLGEAWANTMQTRDNYRLLVSGVNPGEVTTINNKLKSLSTGVNVYQKSYLGNVLVINVAAPNVPPQKIEAFLRDSNEPQFKVKKLSDHYLMLDVL